MITRTITKLRGALFGAVAAALILTTATALAGSGVGGVFNLGQVNTVDAQTSLNGNPGGNPLLKVTSTGTAAAVRGVATNGIGTNGVSTSGVGQQGLSTSGIGTLGTHGGTTGSSPGVQGETNSTDPAGAGVVGKNTGGGPGLRAIVNAGAPPLAVNSSAKVASLNADLLDGLDSAAFWKLGGNAATNPGTDFLGTSDNKAVEFKVNGQRALRIEPAAVPNLIGGSAANAVLAGAFGATILGGAGFGVENIVTDNFGSIGGGAHNTAGDRDAANVPNSASNATVSGGVGNVAGAEGAAVGGGEQNTASGFDSAIAGGLLNAALNDYDFVGAGTDNQAGSASGGGASAIVAGTGNRAPGGSAFIGAGGINQATANYAFVGSGQANTASGAWSAVSGGHTNTASGDRSAVAGGDANTTSGDTSSVAGGQGNTASGAYSSVAGGQGNTASSLHSFVGGGYHNTAGGHRAFAAGTQAQAIHDGSFVWADDVLTDVTSPGPNTFTVRSSNGIWLGTTSTPSIGLGRFIDTSTGAYLSSTGTWTNNSDRARKHGFRPLNTKGVLAKVARMPIASWSYKAEKPSIRHIGPMAQDFYKAFGLGLDDRHITTIDEGGVALAAIQGLYHQNQRLDHDNRVLHGENFELRRRNAGLSTRLGRLEQAMWRFQRELEATREAPAGGGER